MTTIDTDAPVRDPSRLTGRLRAILAVVLIADVLDLMDSTITNIAAPTIARELGGGQSLIKWLGTSYALALGVLLVVGGRLGDRYGKRRVFLVGIAGFTVASLLCGVAVDPTMLIIARLLQGGFGALLIPQGIGILTATFTRAQMPRAFSAFGPIMGVSAVLGPIVAGFIIDLDVAGLTWRPMFLINIVLGASGLAAAARLLPHDTPLLHDVPLPHGARSPHDTMHAGDAPSPHHTPSGTVRIDGLGSGLLGAGMLCLMYGLIQGSTAGWHTMPIASLTAGAVFFAGFCARQRFAAEPLILPSLLRNRGFTAGLLLGLAFFASVNGLAYVISLFFQTALGLTASRAALGLGPLMLGIIAASMVCRPLIAALGRRLVLLGLVLTLIGAAGLWATVLIQGTATSVWTVAPAILVLGAGMGACFSSIYDIAIGDITPAEAGSASGALSAVQQLASAIGSAVVTTVYFGQLRTGDGAHAMTTSVAVVAAIAVLCLAVVPLLPRSAPAEAAG